MKPLTLTGPRLKAYIEEAYDEGVDRERARDYAHQRNSERLQRSQVLPALTSLVTATDLMKGLNRMTSLFYPNHEEEVLSRLYKKHLTPPEDNEPEHELLDLIADEFPKLHKYLSEIDQDEEERIVWVEAVKDLAFIISKLPNRPKRYEYYSRYFVDPEGEQFSPVSLKSLGSQVNNDNELIEPSSHILRLF